MDYNHAGFHEYNSEQCSAILSRLPGVFAARLRFEDDNLIEIHVLGTTERSPKQIARDIQSAIFASYGIEIDHRIISIAQLPSDPFHPESVITEVASKPARPLFEGLDAHQSNGQFNVSVHLSWNGQSITGEGHCRDTLAQRNRAVARATLDAINSFLGMEYFSLIEVKQIIVWDVTIAVTVLEFLEKGASEPNILVGAATQRDNPSAGIVRSTLDGLNRCLGKLSPCK